MTISGKSGVLRIGNEECAVESWTVAPQVHDWKICTGCGHAERVPRPFGTTCRDCSARHKCWICLRNMRAYEEDWLKCRVPDALANMAILVDGKHAATIHRGIDVGMTREFAKKNQEAGVSWLRCVIGNPFRPIKLDKSWLMWRDGTVRRLAENVVLCHHCVGRELGTRNAYKMQHPCRLCHGTRRVAPHAYALPILADALEESGCADEYVLRHLREPGQHWNDCHVLRAILEAS